LEARKLEANAQRLLRAREDAIRVLARVDTLLYMRTPALAAVAPTATPAAAAGLAAGGMQAQAPGAPGGYAAAAAAATRRSDSSDYGQTKARSCLRRGRPFVRPCTQGLTRRWRRLDAEEEAADGRHGAG
jgi:hypothetical protein